MIVEFGAGQRGLLRLGGLTRGRSGTKQIHLRFIGLQPRLQLVPEIASFRAHALQAIAKLIELRIAQPRAAEFFLQQIQLALPVGDRGLQIDAQFLIDAFGHFRRIDPRIWGRRRGFAVTGIDGARFCPAQAPALHSARERKPACQQAQRDGGQSEGTDRGQNVAGRLKRIDFKTASAASLNPGA